jgi:uncharacterized protein YegL
MPQPDLTEIIVILDRSGSMACIRHDMEGGFDTFIGDQTALPGQCRVTLVKFDDVVELVYEGLSVRRVPKLQLEPRGATALYDAIGLTLDAVSTRLHRTPEEARPARVLVVIITDGCENASHTYDRNRVFSRIRKKRDVDGWEFVYFGANQDAYAIGHSMGIDKAYGYATTPAGTRDVTSGMSESVGSYRRGEGYTTPANFGPPPKREPGSGGGGGEKPN